MGRKIDLKKIEDITKCQVTFSKRRTSLMKKANEVAVCCDVDVVFIAFSPSGRVSKFCNRQRIEDVLQRYIDLPSETRLTHISNVKEKVEKLRQLDHINGDTSKLHYLDKQIENLELQIKKSELQLQILETDLRDYELGPGQEPSLHQLSWCERNLNHTLEKIIAKKNALAEKSSMLNEPPIIIQAGCNQPNQMGLESQAEVPIPFPSHFNENAQVPIIETENPFNGQILMQLDPWISPYSARVRESILQDLCYKANYTTNENVGPSNIIPNFPIPENVGPSNIIPNFPFPSNMCDFPILDTPNIFQSEIMLTSDVQIPPSHISFEQSLMVDQPFLNFQGQNNVDAWNNTSSVIFTNAIHKSSQSSCNIQGPRFTSVTTVTTNDSRAELFPQSHFDEMGTGFVCPNSFLSQLINNMEGQEIGDLNMDNSFNNNNGNTSNDNVNIEDSRGIINRDETQSQAPCHVPQQNEVFQDMPNDTFLPEDTLGDDSVWTSAVQRSSLWEWDDLLIDENFSIEDYF